jgi:hypothetical protein
LERWLTVVRRVFLSADQKFWVEELSIRSGTNLVDWGWIKIDKDASRNVLAVVSLCEESLIGSSVDGGVGIRLAIG